MEIWQYILLALYTCPLMYRGFGDVETVVMEMDPNTFDWSLYILQMRGLISGCDFDPDVPEGYRTIKVNREKLLLTPEGFMKAEGMLEAKTSGEQLEEIKKILTESGFNRYAKDILKYQELILWKS